MLLLVQSQGFLWTIIHGVMQLAFSAIRKQMSIQNRLCAHVASIMIELCLGLCFPFSISVALYLSFNLFLAFNAIIYVSRYRVEVMINYKDESTKFLLWDRECTEFIGQSADEVNTLKVEVGVYNCKIEI